MFNFKSARLIAALAVLGVFLGVGALKLKADWVRVPCTHMVQAHAFDVYYGPYGPYNGPCTHMVPLHPYDLVYY